MAQENRKPGLGCVANWSRRRDGRTLPRTGAARPQRRHSQTWGVMPSRAGDWEADTVIGAGRKGMPFTATD